MPFRDRFCASVYRFFSICLCLHLCVFPEQGSLCMVFPHVLSFLRVFVSLPPSLPLPLSLSLALSLAHSLSQYLSPLSPPSLLSLLSPLSPLSPLSSLSLSICLCLCLYALQAAYAYGHDPTKRLPVPDAVYTKDPPYDMAVVDIGGKVSGRVCVRVRIGVLLLSFYPPLPHLCTRTNTCRASPGNTKKAR